jgi:ketosteroid isomerase-like protein
MKQNSLVTAIAGMALFFVFSNCQAQTTNGLSAVKKTIEKTNAIYFDLFSKKDAAIVNLYTDDACLLSPNTLPVSGRKALEKDFKEAFADVKIKGVKFQTKEVYGDGKEYVTEEGTWQVFKQDGKPLDDGKYLKLWKKTKTGWKIFRDVFNSNHKAQ